MNPIEIITKTIDDNTPSWPELNADNMMLGEITGVTILENGTVNNKAAIAFKIQIGADNFVLAQLTQGEFEMIAGSVRGSVQRFEDLKKMRAAKGN